LGFVAKAKQTFSFVVPEFATYSSSS